MGLVQRPETVLLERHSLEGMRAGWQQQLEAAHIDIGLKQCRAKEPQIPAAGRD